MNNGDAKEKVWEFLSKTYGQTAEMIFAYFDEHTEEQFALVDIDCALVELVSEGRAFRCDKQNNLFHAVIPQPKWVEKVLNLKEECIENCEPPTGFSLSYNKVERELTIYPIPYDVKHFDGSMETKFPDYCFYITPILQILDELEGLTVSNGDVWITGTIDGEECNISIERSNLHDIPPVGVFICATGKFRKYGDEYDEEEIY